MAGGAILACESRTIRVRGQVQGVGFRPFVWQLARELNLVGTVANDGEGVLIEVAGEPAALDRFEGALSANAPPLARVTGVSAQPGTGAPPPDDFTIIASVGGQVATGIVPDAATCSECVSEIFDPADRRFGYAFGNCTHCGPRLTIVRTVPYDRQATSMAKFPMCADCGAEYANPDDRRFHAQPIACPACGPKLWLEDASGPVAEDNAIAATAKLLNQGKIVAIKGIGGFHLACRASDENAVNELRRRKSRDAKPFALMVPSVNAAGELCKVSSDAAKLLTHRSAPIVLLLRNMRAHTLPEGIAPGQDHLGLMLPYSPLHHLLLSAMDEALVMTSANRSEEPQVTDNAEAREKLADLADAYLMHDRDIVNRVDDSVVALDRRGPVVLRRARGMAPDPIALPKGLASDTPILAMGGELKATFCLVRGEEAILSPHIGDLEHAIAFADYRRMLDLFLKLYDITPGLIAVDGHGDYLSTKLGRQMAGELGVPVVQVGHHHAHFAACLAEHGCDVDASAFAIVCDGLGLGTDGTLWGGEVFRGGYTEAARVASMPAALLPGGGAAMKQPWRNLLAHLVLAFGEDWREQVPALARHLPDEGQLKLLQTAMVRGINSPACSSAGRLFDAVAAALGLHASAISHEGQAAMALEALARPHAMHAAAYPVAVAMHGDGMAKADLAPMWRALAADIGDGTHAGVIAARFHATFVRLMLELLMTQQPPRGTASTRAKVALSGGVFNNRIIREAMANALEDRGLEPLCHFLVPSGDGGLALGQATIATALWNANRISC